MKNRKRRMITMVLACCLSANTVFAGFLDDFIANKTTGNANYLSGQQRGMLFGGSFAAHWPVTENNNLITTSPPKISAGCGGIDFYGGSFAFLKPEMLVKKLQNVLQNSAGTAFMMALDAVCSKCNTLMNMAENLSNNLNKMSMDDCNAAKGLVTSVRSSAEDIATGMQMGDISSGVGMALTDSYATLKQSIPAVNTLSDMNNWFNSQTGKSSTNIPSTSGCTDPIMAGLFPSDSSAYPVSALVVIGNQMGMPQQYQDMLRGIVGDMKIEWINSPVISTVAPCSNNMTVSMDYLTTGNYEVKSVNGVCSQATDTNANLQNYMSNELTNIMNAMKAQNGSGTGLQAADMAFLQSMPLPVLYGLRMAVISGTDSSMVPSMSSLAASEWMAAMMQDLIQRYGQILAALHDVDKNTTDNTGSGAAGTMCNLSVITKASKGSIEDLVSNAKYFGTTINVGLQKQIEDFRVAQSVGQQLDSLNAKLDATLKKSFGPSVAYRMMQRIKQNTHS